MFCNIFNVIKLVCISFRFVAFRIKDKSEYRISEAAGKSKRVHMYDKCSEVTIVQSPDFSTSTGFSVQEGPQITPLEPL